MRQHRWECCDAMVAFMNKMCDAWLGGEDSVVVRERFVYFASFYPKLELNFCPFCAAAAPPPLPEPEAA